ncbi:MAG: hypothetical protein WBJ21_00350 [Burkholderiaceae bacterium]
MIRLLALAVAVCSLCGSVAALAADPDAVASLTVCLNKDNAPFSFKKESGPGGFDYLLAQAVAQQLGKSLEVKWYEKERRSRGPVSVKTSVLINAGVCELVGGFPLIQSSLDRPSGESASLPPIDGMTPENPKRSIAGSQLMASAPYHFAGVTAVLGPKMALQKLESLDQAKSYQLGNRPASIGDLIAMSYKKGLLINNIVHVGMQDDPLDALARSEFDLSLIEAHKFDRYLQENPATLLRSSGLYFPVGFNIGFVSTAEHSALLAAVSAVVEEMRKEGRLEKIARSAAMTFIVPQSPAVRTGLGLEQFTQ